MEKILKILTVNRKHNDGFYIAGAFDTDEQLDRHVDLYLFEEDDFEVEEISYQREVTAMADGNYAYRMLVINATAFAVESILDPNDFKGLHIEENTKAPLMITLAAKTAEEALQKCLQLIKEGKVRL